MIKMITAAMLAAAAFIAPSANAQSVKGVPLISAQEREAQEAWWAARAVRQADKRMAACMAMPECNDRRMMPAAPSNQG